jgi:hypothetical protein
VPSTRRGCVETSELVLNEIILGELEIRESHACSRKRNDVAHGVANTSARRAKSVRLDRADVAFVVLFGVGEPRKVEIGFSANNPTVGQLMVVAHM